MDCFYAAVETKFNPSFRGKALAVGGPPNSRSVLCTANYEARKYGVRAALPSSQAMRLCPHLILVPPNFALYKEESRKIQSIFARYTDKIEPLSLDEAYLDVSGSKEFNGSASRLALHIRKQIFEELKLPVSAGIAPNKFLAKIASDWRKPNNQFTITPQDIDAFMPALPVERIFGIGKVTAESLHQKGLRTCADLQKLSLYELQKIFGRRGQDMYKLCRGQDDRELNLSRERKSLTVEETFSRDLHSLDEIRQALPELYESWCQRMDRGDYWSKINGWVLKLKFFDFQSTTHEQSHKTKPDIKDFESLLTKAYERNPKAVRLLGLGARLKVEKQNSSQQTLMDN
jgi:DNA polymerase-4